MAYNLFVAYDLRAPGIPNYDAVRDRIRELGDCYQFQYSLYYVHTRYSPNDAYAHVAQALDANDRLAVINAFAGNVVSNWDNPPIDEINTIWTAP